MTNEVQVFNNGKIDLPVKEVGGQVYFEAEAAAIGLGLTDSRENKTYVRWARVRNYLNSPQVAKGSWITEPEFYKLAFKASNDVAEKFQDWVASEVLPSIRKHGAYATPETIDSILANPDNGIKLLQALKEERSQKEQALLEASKEREARAIAEQRVNELAPKALFADSVAASKSTVLVGELAKILRGNGVDIGANRLFKWMRENGYLINRKGSDWNMPTQRSMDMGLFKIKETTINHSNGVTTISKTPKVTGKGQQYFINKFLKS